ncbi:hypothetical protein VUR80DRAFT_7685 [Thermomyces stellatus]
MNEIDRQVGLPLAITGSGSANTMSEKKDGPTPPPGGGSVYFARTWLERPTHLETTSASMYGHPFVLISNGYVTKAVPSYVEVLVLEEQWYHRRRPHAKFLPLYRYSLCRDLKLVAHGVSLSEVRRVVFIPKPECWVLGRGSQETRVVQAPQERQRILRSVPRAFGRCGGQRGWSRRP